MTKFYYFFTNFYKNNQSKSLVMIGGCDRAFNSSVIKNLEKNDFKTIDDSKYVSRDKYFLDEGIGDYETLSKYCLEKL